MSRAATSMGMLVASPQIAENTMNRQIDVTKVRTSPKRRPIHPVSGCMTAAASMYELAAQVPSELLTPRLPEIEGTETLTMVMSRISMKEAVAIATVRKKSLPPCNGGYSPAIAGCAESAMRRASDRCQGFGARPRRLRHSLSPDPAYTPAYPRPVCRRPAWPTPVHPGWSYQPSPWLKDRPAAV